MSLTSLPMRAPLLGQPEADSQRPVSPTKRGFLRNLGGQPNVSPVRPDPRGPVNRHRRHRRRSRSRRRHRSRSRSHAARRRRPRRRSRVPHPPPGNWTPRAPRQLVHDPLAPPTFLPPIGVPSVQPPFVQPPFAQAFMQQPLERPPGRFGFQAWQAPTALPSIYPVRGDQRPAEPTTPRQAPFNAGNAGMQPPTLRVQPQIPRVPQVAQVPQTPAVSNLAISKMNKAQEEQIFNQVLTCQQLELSQQLELQLPGIAADHELDEGLTALAQYMFFRLHYFVTPQPDHWAIPKHQALRAIAARRAFVRAVQRPFDSLQEPEVERCCRFLFSRFDEAHKPPPQSIGSKEFFKSGAYDIAVEAPLRESFRSRCTLVGTPQAKCLCLHLSCAAFSRT